MDDKTQRQKTSILGNVPLLGISDRKKNEIVIQITQGVS